MPTVIITLRSDQIDAAVESLGPFKHKSSPRLFSCWP
jgi:hypothetical protein